MRIGLNPADPQQSITADQAKKASTAATNQAVTNQSELSPVGDESVFSQDTVTLSSLATQALATPEIRQTQVDSLRQSVSSGEYQLDPNGIAAAMLSSQI
jgi:flagellar biosynthesis anti-sigma factor FlgM